MNMAFVEMGGLSAISAQPTIAFVDELAYLAPLFNEHSRIPGIVLFVQDKFIHASPCHALPSRASLRPAKPDHVPPRQTTPLPRRRYPYPTSPCQAVPRLARPCPTLPGYTRLNPTPTTSLFHLLKAGDHKPAKLWAIIADANGLARQDKHIVHDFGGNFIINDVDCKG